MEGCHQPAELRCDGFNRDAKRSRVRLTYVTQSGVAVCVLRREQPQTACYAPPCGRLSSAKFGSAPIAENCANSSVDVTSRGRSRRAVVILANGREQLRGPGWPGPTKALLSPPFIRGHSSGMRQFRGSWFESQVGIGPLASWRPCSCRGHRKESRARRSGRRPRSIRPLVRPCGRKLCGGIPVGRLSAAGGREEAGEAGRFGRRGTWQGVD